MLDAIRLEAETGVALASVHGEYRSISKRVVLEDGCNFEYSLVNNDEFGAPGVLNIDIDGCDEHGESVKLARCCIKIIKDNMEYKGVSLDYFDKSFEFVNRELGENSEEESLMHVAQDAMFLIGNGGESIAMVDRLYVEEKYRKYGICSCLLENLHSIIELYTNEKICGIVLQVGNYTDSKELNNDIISSIYKKYGFIGYDEFMAEQIKKNESVKELLSMANFEAGSIYMVKEINTDKIK